MRYRDKKIQKSGLTPKQKIIAQMRVDGAHYWTIMKALGLSEAEYLSQCKEIKKFLSIPPREDTKTGIIRSGVLNK